MSWNGNLTEDVGQTVHMAEVEVLFSSIEKMEEKRKNFIEESRAIHEATVKEWDRLYEALKAIAEKHKKSEAFRDSKLFKKFFDNEAGIPAPMSEDVRGVR